MNEPWHWSLHVCHALLENNHSDHRTCIMLVILWSICLFRPTVLIADAIRCIYEGSQTLEDVRFTYTVLMTGTVLCMF